jgi:hypothetical protein
MVEGTSSLLDDREPTIGTKFDPEAYVGMGDVLVTELVWTVIVRAPELWGLVHAHGCNVVTDAGAVQIVIDGFALTTAGVGDA